MSNLIEDLIAELRRGNYSDPAGKIAALAAAIKETEGDHTALIVSLLEAHQAALRIAGMDAAQHRDVPQISKALLPLIADREKEVRLNLARCSAGFIKSVRNQIIRE